MTYPVRQVTSDSEAMLLIIEHLLEQSHTSRCITESVGCGYRGVDEYLFSSEYLSPCDQEVYDYLQDRSEEEIQTSACAVGCLISDDLYDIEIEGLPSTDPSVIGIVSKSHPNWIIEDKSITMMRSLQCIHDSVPPPYWPVFFSVFNIDDFYEKSFELLCRTLVSKTNKKWEGKVPAGAYETPEYAVLLRQAFEDSKELKSL